MSEAPFDPRPDEGGQPTKCPQCGARLEWGEGDFTRYCPECRMWWRGEIVEDPLFGKLTVPVGYTKGSGA